MANSIPIQNIYYLLCYAWNRLEEGEIVDVSGIDSTELVDLFASVLTAGMGHLMRRGLEQGYQTFEEELSCIRGRIQIATSARRMLLQHGKALCRHDELTPNTLANRIIKSTLRLLGKVDSIDADIKASCLKTYRELGGIDDIEVSKKTFRSVQLYANNRYYRFLLNVCQLITENLLVDEMTGKYKFRDFLRDERRMARLFESFVFNFIRSERNDLSVRKEKISWDAKSDDPDNLFYLPQMETDISVRNAEKTLIIDTKYYSKTMSTYFGSESIHSSNLYQILAYLKNMEQRVGPDVEAEGLLLYPQVNRTISLDYTIQGHLVGIQTLDLAAPWNRIQADINGMINRRFPQK